MDLEHRGNERRHTVSLFRGELEKDTTAHTFSAKNPQRQNPHRNPIETRLLNNTFK